MDWRLPILAGYAIGSVSWAVIVGRLALRSDIRILGSGTAGGTNVGRVAGLRWGMLVAALDVGKGLLSTVVGTALAGGDVRGGMLAGVAAVAGHIFPVWFGFRGGKGIATFAGTCTLVFPQVMVPAALTWVLAYGLARGVAKASALAAAMLPVVGFAVDASAEQILYLAAMAVLISGRHMPEAVKGSKGLAAAPTRRRKLA